MKNYRKGVIKAKVNKAAIKTTEVTIRAIEMAKTAKRITGAVRGLALTKECQKFLRFHKKFEMAQQANLL